MKNYFVNRIIFAGLILLVVCTTWASDEKTLIAVLQSNAGAVEKCDACQQLRICGTVESVGALAAVLSDDRVGHAARYALEGMPYAEAGAAIRDAIGKTSGGIKAGLVDSAGWRRDTTAVPLLVPLLSDADAALAAASATALGRIGGKDAIMALKAASNNLNPATRRTILEALLQCAEERLSAADTSEAAKIYRDIFHSDAAPVIGAAAWRGLVLSDANQRPELVVKALCDHNELLERVALKAVREINDAQLAKTFLKQWDSLPAAAQLAVLDAHVQFGVEVLDTVCIASQSPYPSVRIGAWQAMANLNDASLIPALTRAASTGESLEKKAARDTLARLHGPEVFKYFLACLGNAETAEKAELLGIFGKRGDVQAVPVLLKYASATEPSVRFAALDSLRRLAVSDTLAPLLDLIVSLKSASDREPVLKALRAVCQTSSDKYQTDPLIITAMNRLPAAERGYLLPLLAETATPDALVEVQKAMQINETRLDAISTLSQWPNAAPAKTLFEAARNSTDLYLGILALRGGIAVTGRESDFPARLVLLQEAFLLANRAEEKKQALSCLGGIPCEEAIELALKYLDDSEVINEAALAAIGVAESMAEKNPQLADKTARQVLKYSKAPSVIKRAWSLRSKSVDKSPFIRDWLVCGPYRQDGKFGATALFDIVFGPEKTDEAVKWYAAPVGDTVNLAGLFPNQTDCAAYLKAEIITTESIDAVLLMGSDDGIKVWLNGAVVFSNNIDRGQVADQDMAFIKLNQGSNELLLKITQGGSGWSACARIVGIDGSPITTLSVKPTDAAIAKPETAAKVVSVPAKLPAHDNFHKLCLSDRFYAESASYGDFNHDGKMDVVAGPFWFEGPSFSQRHEYRPAKAFDPNAYSDNFLIFADDFNGDDWADILCVPFPGKEAFWYANPAGKEGNWECHLAHPNVGNESPAWGDITGDGRSELLFCIDGFLGYAGPDLAQPNQPWVFHVISTNDKRYQIFTHGAGFGDINGDGRKDVIEAVGWWEQPADTKSDKPWIFYPFRFAEEAAQMLIYDVDGDDLNDVITVWNCHLYGLIWWKQIRQADGQINWEQNVILSPNPDVSTTDFRVSQMHAMKLIDMNNDGLEDILTGKRFWAHGPAGDKETDAPAVVFWFELQRHDNGNVAFFPHLIDDDSGVGTQVEAVDLNGDKQPDIIVANKKGIFLNLSGLAK